MGLLAFSVQDQVTKYGAYVGIACFFGLAVLSLLYFAQAREVKRLREWAGRAPERAQELEEAAIAHAEQVRRAPPPLPARQTPAPAVAPAVAAPAPVPVAANGAVELAPAEVAALAFARAAGVHEPHLPVHHPAPVAAAAAATPSAVATATNGHGTADVPAPATSAARRAEPAPLRQQTPPPLPPRRPLPPPRRTASSPPPRREGSLRSAAVVGVIGVVLVVAVVLVASNVYGGGSGKSKTLPPNVTPTATAKGTARASATPAALNKDNVKIAVYNGTLSTGLAATLRDKLVLGGYKKANTGVGDYTPNQAPNPPRATSTVMYQRGDRAIARAVAGTLGITAANVQQIDATATQAINGTWDVVVIVGADKAP